VLLGDGSYLNITVAGNWYRERTPFHNLNLSATEHFFESAHEFSELAYKFSVKLVLEI
jgi:hypothetical protein